MKAHSPISSFLIFVVSWISLATASGIAEEAVLRPGDKIRLNIKGVPDEERVELSGEYTVSEAGTIPLPYISDPKAVGEKPSVLARKIEAAYREAQIYTNPTIVINMGDERNIRRISVTGGVNRNGPVEYYDGMTLLDAISAAGGLSDFAKQKEVKVIRGTQSAVCDLDAIVKQEKEDVKLAPGDKIIVPETGRKI